MTLSQSTTRLRCAVILDLYGYSATQSVNQVDMIRDLVLYFLKQGPYDGAGDIAVLCAYLGQLQKVRAALRDLKVAVSVDERDEEQLERTGLAGDEEIGFAQVQVARHVRKILRYEDPPP
jgi:hypothetical protein